MSAEGPPSGPSRGRSAVDPEIRRLLQALGQAINQAAETSADVGEAVRRIRAEGYTLYLALDLQPRRRGETPRVPLSEPAAAAPVARPPAEPAFRLSADDVGFLASLGIDATRPARRRR